MYEIVINRKIGKRLAKLSASEQKKIKKVLRDLKKSPLPKGRDLKKLHSKKYPIWRIRIGDLRIIYAFFPKEKIIKVVKIDFRGRVY